MQREKENSYEAMFNRAFLVLTAVLLAAIAAPPMLHAGGKSPRANIGAPASSGHGAPHGHLPIHGGGPRVG